jgi:hypothetical protein
MGFALKRWGRDVLESVRKLEDRERDLAIGVGSGSNGEGEQLRHSVRVLYPSISNQTKHYQRDENVAYE